jgi:hypothetical protein
MKKMMYFKDYGKLEWLDAEQFYAEPWKLVCAAEGDDGEMYDILVKDGEYRYSQV